MRRQALSVLVSAASLALAAFVASGLSSLVALAYPTECKKLIAMFWEQDTIIAAYKAEGEQYNLLLRDLKRRKDEELKCTLLDDLGLSREEYRDRLEKCKTIYEQIKVLEDKRDALIVLKGKAGQERFNIRDRLSEYKCKVGKNPGTLGIVSISFCPESVMRKELKLRLERDESFPDNPIRSDPNTSGGFRCQYSAAPKPAKTRISFSYLREPGGPRYCKAPRDSHGYLNSKTHEIQVHVPPILNQADSIRRDLLKSLEEANIGWPCKAYGDD